MNDFLAESSEEVITLDNVMLTYEAEHSVNALEDIHIKINEGEFVCLLGPSGCGKSTLLKIIAGFIKPTKGTATMSGTPINGPDWHRGVVFQQPPLYPWLNVEDNVKFGLKMRKIPSRIGKETVNEYLEKVGLLEFGKNRIYELSGGMRQRVAIARVLVNNPKVLLMDEPFGALDALTREQMQNLIRKIWWETGKTILFITHDVDEALSLGTRVLIMSKRPGRIIKEFKVNFTKSITGENSDRTRYTNEFQELREQILNLINKTDATYSI
ncbi:ABC transporter ATP-binding protein [Clostridium aminobutyricum]|uniref:ABC transporter ATP-binding protein n=2 Tax=Clostridium aminobutyricum TaxID=33953 RepID=A0A939IJD1_CLOAM|nr:ABC transporter ATP-binding protein [Clostridium aminobutyricum]